MFQSFLVLTVLNVLAIPIKDQQTLRLCSQNFYDLIFIFLFRGRMKDEFFILPGDDDDEF